MDHSPGIKSFSIMKTGLGYGDSYRFAKPPLIYFDITDDKEVSIYSRPSPVIPPAQNPR